MFVSDVNSMRELDRLAAIAGVPSLTLMERAGEGLAEAAQEMLKGVARPKVLVVCGKGNNGSDGLAAARLLLAKGVPVTTLLLFSKSVISGDALANLKKLESSFEKTVDGIDPARWPDFKTFQVIIDAMFGTGFSGRAQGLFKTCIERINDSGAGVLSADTPSGINSDTGEVAGPAVMADITVAFGLPKAGQLFYPARAFVGDLRVKDIGLPVADVKRLCGNTLHITRSIAAKGLPARQGSEHKNSCGRVLVVAGSTGLTGAACLAARAALKSGAGVVTLCAPKSLNTIFETKLTEEMTVPLNDNGKGFLLASHAKAILALLGAYDVLVLGPGLGRNKSTQELARALVKNSPVPVVLDADGINAFEGRPGLIAKRRAPLILTPHEGELKRLTGRKNAPATAGERVRFVRETAKNLSAGLLLKGASTLISLGGQEVYINTTGNPGMATAGAGDVLTGLIGGLVAQNRDLLQAALSAAYLHGLSGDAAAVELTEYAMTAGDLIGHLPQAFKKVLEE
jgi:NAD(P)H-hydrate epimerase